MNKYYKTKIIFLISLILCIFIILALLGYFSFLRHQNSKLHSFSHKLEDKYQTLSLYHTNSISNQSNSSSIIGKIEIPKINLNYPIISECSEELLKISPCRLCGPSPNEVGNLCIAGHNYDNGNFFSNLNKLSIGDVIRIYNLNNEYLEYSIYEKFEVEVNNTSILEQNTNNKKEVTLITCNNRNKNRAIFKARETD